MSTLVNSRGEGGKIWVKFRPRSCLMAPYLKLVIFNENDTKCFRIGSTYVSTRYVYRHNLSNFGGQKVNNLDSTLLYDLSYIFTFKVCMSHVWI